MRLFGVLLLALCGGPALAQNQPPASATCGQFDVLSPGPAGTVELDTTPKGFVSAGPGRRALVLYNASWTTLALAPRPVQPEINSPSSLTLPGANSRAICGADAVLEWWGVAGSGTGSLIFWEVPR